MHEAFIENISRSANLLRRNQDNYPIYDRYLLRGVSVVETIKSRLGFPEIKPLTFDSEKMIRALLAADVSTELKLLRASYPHYGQHHVLGYGIVARSVFTTNLDNGGNIVSKACQILGIPVDSLNDVPGHALASQTHYRDGSVPGYVLNDDYIHELIDRARKFKK